MCVRGNAMTQETYGVSDKVARVGTRGVRGNVAARANRSVPKKSFLPGCRSSPRLTGCMRSRKAPHHKKGILQMAKKTYNEKLHSPGDLPKIEDLSGKPEAVRRLGGAAMLIAAPLQYNEIMAKIPVGRVSTSDRLRAHLASGAGADVTCPLTAGIFINICAHASEERPDGKIPWWRTLRAQGELNEKYPGGLDAQKLLLEMEGHSVIQKGKRSFVAEYERCLADLD